MPRSDELRIVVGFDGSDAARRCLTRARGLHADAATIVVVAVVPDLRSPGLASELSGEPLDTESILAEARELLGGLPAARIETRVERGDPAVVLIDVAREVGSGLLIVGRRGGDFVTRTLLGSVAERVVQQAPCDVLVVA